MSYGCGIPCAGTASPLGFLGNNWWIWIVLFFLLFNKGGFDCFGSNTWIWIILAAIILLPNLGCGNLFNLFKPGC